MDAFVQKVISILHKIILQDDVFIFIVENDFVVTQNDFPQANCLGKVILDHGKVISRNENDNVGHGKVIFHIESDNIIVGNDFLQN